MLQSIRSSRSGLILQSLGGIQSLSGRQVHEHDQLSQRLYTSLSQPVDATSQPQNDVVVDNSIKDVKHYENLMLKLKDSSGRHLMRDVVGEMKLNGIRPSQYMYWLGLSLNAEIGRSEDAEFFLKEMRRSGYTPGFKCYAAMFDVLIQNKQTVAALRLMREMEYRGMKLSRTNYVALLNVCSALGEIKQVQQVVAEMKKHGIPLYQSGYSCVIGSYTRSMRKRLPQGFEAIIESLLRESEQESDEMGHTLGKYRPMTLNAAMQALSTQGAAADAVRLFEEAMAAKTIEPNGQTYNVALQSYLYMALGKNKGWLTMRVLETEAKRRRDAQDLEPFVRQVLETDAALQWLNDPSVEEMLQFDSDIDDTSSAHSHQSSRLAVAENVASSSSDEDIETNSVEEEEDSSDSDDEDTESELKASLAQGMEELHKRAQARALSVFKKQIMAERIDSNAWIKANQLYQTLIDSEQVQISQHLRVLKAALDLLILSSTSPSTAAALAPCPPYEIAHKALDGIDAMQDCIIKPEMITALLSKAVRPEVEDLSIARRLFDYVVKSSSDEQPGSPDIDPISVWKFVLASVYRGPESESQSIVEGCKYLLSKNRLGTSHTKTLSAVKRVLERQENTSA